MDESDVSFKKGIPFYIAGIAIITTGFLFYPVPSWFSLIAFITAGIIFYLGWLRAKYVIYSTVPVLIPLLSLFTILIPTNWIASKCDKCGKKFKNDDGTNGSPTCIPYGLIAFLSMAVLLQ